MMAGVGITAYGAYVPITRLDRAAIAKANAWFGGPRGKGDKAVSGWDEDVCTMAVEAARDCLENFDRAQIDAVWLASTTAPFADRQNAGIVKEALNLGDVTGALDAGGSQRVATSQLMAAFGMSKGTGQTILQVTGERTQPKPASAREMSSGDAAAALLVGTKDVIAELIGTHSVTADFVDHFREAGSQADYDWEARWVRDEGYVKIMGDAIVDALAACRIEGGLVDHLIVPIAARGVPEMLARKAGISPNALADQLDGSVGHAGAAHPLLMLAAVLEKAKPGETILLSAFGQGADVILLRVTDRIGTTRPRLGVSGWLARKQASDNYLKYLFHRGHLALDRGMRAEHDEKTALPAMWRQRKGTMALVGGKCSKTGTVQFPKTEMSVNSNDHAIRTQEDYPLAEIPARVMTYTADSLTYSPDPPTCYGNVEFEGGGRLMAEFTDVDPQAIEVGDEMRMMFRIKAIDEKRGFRRYFWKAAPAF
ncbi:OB-fold domain-containing protein [Pseudopontixanthobacter vadosimaris]|uniref:OB-fold domain-containing protein n=1 Tax=Pseudopontixanthobacter vadosimaris TaxID=2726450 RepID=UPI001F0FE8B9|nr:OB-fold domain-containing protein [Pseudopontixanthobacter vadosimaris]